MHSNARRLPSFRAGLDIQYSLVCPFYHTVRQKKRNQFSFMNKSFNTQFNLTKFSTFTVNGYYHRCYLFNSWKLH